MEQIAVIICVNNEQYYEECLFYLDRLNLPEGYTLEVLAIRGAGSIYELIIRQCSSRMQNTRYICIRMSF